VRKNIKKAIAIILVLVLVSANVVIASADGSERMWVRAIFEEGSAVVDWDNDERTVLIQFMGNEIILHTERPLAYINEVAIPLQDDIILSDGRSYITPRDLETVMGNLRPLGPLGGTIATINAMIPTVMEQMSIPGVTVALVDAENDFTWTAGFGYADTLESIPVDEHTLFALASISKTFTAVAVMQLVEAGIIDLDEPVVTYLPEFSQLPDILYGDGNYRNITVRMLLSHASGIMGNLMMGIMTTDGYYRYFMENFFDNLAEFPMAAPERYMFAYANNNFTLLGLLVAALGTEYESLFDGFVSYTKENIFAPAGMEMTTFYLEEQHMPYLSQSYRNAETREDLVFLNALPTMGIFSNAYDMAQFMHIMLNDGALPDDGQLLSANSVGRMFELQNERLGNPSRIAMYNMGFGLGILYNTGMEGFTRIGHGGNAIHFHSEMAIDRESGIGVFISVNSVSGLPAVGSLMTNILLTAIHEKTGELRLPASDETVEPIEFNYEDFEGLAGVFTQAGGAEFIRIEVTEEGLNLYGILPVAMELLPLSNGSFVCTETGLRFWFDEMYEETVIFIGEFRSVLLGTRLDPDVMTVPESFERWIGDYFPQVPEGHVSNLYRIVVGVDENGFAFTRTHTLNGLELIAPLIASDEYGYNFFGFSFSRDADGTWLQIADSRFLMD